ncbi:hypothetical protein CCR75_007845 [Bremia lactucae]|uniref:Centromere protein J C-terminal domain-containing protein n=1 Tax=Bremia lactucae TaxID=4779 RepID=A0A976FJ41_BRELC|nr:hypothetical protein CCR75_007845 [Bremia lactucae]
MAPGRWETRAWRNDDAETWRLLSSSIDNVPVSASNVPFEELMARQISTSEEIDAKTKAICSAKVKKPFLKRGARGWWMQQPDITQKVAKHSLASKTEDVKALKSIETATQRPSAKQQQTQRLSLDMTPPAEILLVPASPQCLSPPASSIRRRQCDSQINTDDDLQDDAWKNASNCSMTSTDTMGLTRLRQSYVARQKHEADEMAEFEAIERDLAAEKEDYVKENQHANNVHGLPLDYEKLPCSAFVSEFNDYEVQQMEAVRSEPLDTAKLKDKHVFDDDDTELLKVDWMTDGEGLTEQLCSHFGYGIKYGNLPSDLSAVSFDDSVPWDDGLSFQPHGSLAHEQPSYAGNEQYDISNGFREKNTGINDIKHGMSSVESDEESIGTFEHNKLNISRMNEKDAGSSLGQQGAQNDEISSSSANSSEGDMSLSDAKSSNYKTIIAPPHVSLGQDVSVSQSRQKLHGAPRYLSTKTSLSKGISAPTTEQVASRTFGLEQSGGNVRESSQLLRQAPPAASEMVLPAVIEEKLNELEEEVKLYKFETCQLQERKKSFERQVKKLALEQDNFARYQQEQRVLLKQIWEQERNKMKKEEKLQKQQCMLRINATVAHAGCSEVELLKAQIAEMQLDATSRERDLKAGNDTLRQRVAILEKENLELRDEYTFLKQIRLEQWEEHKYLIKERQRAFDPAINCENTSMLGKQGDLCLEAAINGAGDRLLRRWSFFSKDGSGCDFDDEKQEISSSNHFYAADVSNPKRYSSDRAYSRSSSELKGVTVGNDIEYDSVIKSVPATNEGSESTEFKWAIPAEEVNKAIQNTGFSRGCVAEVARSSSLSENKRLSRETTFPNDRKEVLYTDGSKKTIYQDGTTKEIYANGRIVINFTNGDHKEVKHLRSILATVAHIHALQIYPDTGISVYYYDAAHTKLTTYPDDRKVYEFPNQQIETNLPDGTTEVQFADGTKKTIRPNGDEFSVFLDGTTMLEQPDGLREVTLLNRKKIRYFPDGQVACVTSNGVESRVSSDVELQQLL